MQEGDQVLPVAQHVAFVLVHVLVEQRLFHLEDHIGFGEDFFRAVDQGRACVHILLIREKGTLAGCFLHKHGGAFGDHLFHGLGVEETRPSPGMISLGTPMVIPENFMNALLLVGTA